MYTLADCRPAVPRRIAMSRRRRRSINQRQTVVARDLCRRTLSILCVCSRPPLSIFLRFRRRRRMHESAVHTTTAETAYNGRLTTMRSSHSFFNANNYLYAYMKTSFPVRPHNDCSARLGTVQVVFSSFSSGNVKNK